LLRQQETVKFLNDKGSENYSKLQHHHKDVAPLPSNHYSALQRGGQPAQSYAQEGPKESTNNVTYEEVPYFEITSKSD